METEVDPVVNQGLVKLEEDGVKHVKNTISKLYSVWEEFGLEPDQKSQRASKVWEHVFKLLSDILNEEITYNKDVKERVKNYSNKLIELCNSLSIPPKTFEGPLIKKEENLRRELDFLTKLRNQRMRAYQNLRSTELKYCQSLDLLNHQLPPVLGVPSEENIKELEQNVMQLKIEKERRHAKLSRMRKELTTILEITEIDPESPVVKSVLQSSEDFPLSNDTFKALEEAIASAQVKKAELENLRKDLLEKLSVLWQRLKVEEKKRMEFLSKHADCRLSTIKSIEEELNRCEKIKRDNIKMFVQSLQEELINLWSSCYASEQQKRQFQFFKTPDSMEDVVLSVFDAEVDKWKKYYDEVKPILKKIAKRQELFELMVVFENKATDPNRFKNRKGNLLKEERDRKKLQRDLPALENEIFLDISAYEEQKGQPFLYYGEDYRAFVTNQWEARKAQKESEKLERQKQHYIQLQNEVTIGTPSKRPLMTTPKSAPSKLFKSNLGMPCTPSMSVSRRVPPRTVGKPRAMPSPLSNQPKRLVSKTVGKLTQSIRSPNFRPNVIQSKDQRVLRERNQLLSLKTKKESSPNTTSYSDFVKDLNATGRCSSRSSVLSTKKPGGTRISLNSSKSKRKSVSKSLRRSTRNSSKITPNLTPARGKFGLPFLI